MNDFYFSASQIAASDPEHGGCLRKWGFDKIDRIKRPDTDSTNRGGTVHDELEGWVKEAKPVTDPVAKAFLPLIPVKHPGVHPEREFRLLTPAGIAVGFIDILVPDAKLAREALPQEYQDLEIPIVFDHKTCKTFRYVETDPTKLAKEPQRVLYGLAARVETGHKGDVELIWNYVTKTPEPKKKTVRFRQSLPILEDGATSILRQAEVLKAARNSTAKANDLEPNLAACDAYGGCPYKLHCAAHVPKSTGGISMPSSETLAKLKAAREAGAAAAAAAPSPETQAEAPKPVDLPKGSTEPPLEKFDTKGLDKPLPEDAPGVVPPDAPRNVSPTDAVVTSKAKRAPKKGTPIDSELLPFLRTKFEAAYAAGDLKTARVLLNAIEELS